MYEKHGQPLEKIVGNILKVAVIRPKQRPYQTNNFYAVLKRQEMLDMEVYDIVHRNKKWLHRMFGKTEKKTVQPVKTKKKLVQEHARKRKTEGENSVNPEEEKGRKPQDNSLENVREKKQKQKRLQEETARSQKKLSFSDEGNGMICCGQAFL